MLAVSVYVQIESYKKTMNCDCDLVCTVVWNVISAIREWGVRLIYGNNYFLLFMFLFTFPIFACIFQNLQWENVPL